MWSFCKVVLTPNAPFGPRNSDCFPKHPAIKRHINGVHFVPARFNTNKKDSLILVKKHPITSNDIKLKYT